MTKGKPMLEIKDLQKSYGDFTALKNLSLAVQRGEIFGLLGPNGAGKTTTIKTCAGLLLPDRGQLKINGYDLLKEETQAKASMGYVPDNPVLYEKLTGREYTTFVARLYGVEEKELSQSSEEYFRLFAMEEQIDDLVGSYSRGMRQKVAIIAALLHRPPFLLLDEPTANLDPRSARLVKDIFLSWKEHGRTVLLSTHVLEIAERLCDRIGIIYQGELLAVDQVDKIIGSSGATLEEVFLELTEGKDEQARAIIAELSGDGNDD